MDFQLLKSTRNQDYGGADEPQCKTIPLKALTHHKFQRIAKHLIIMLIRAINPIKKAKVARGKSDMWAHKLVQWLEHPVSKGQPKRKAWLSEGRGDENNWFQVQCSITPFIS